MKVAVIGAGASGILYAILRKKQFPQDEVILVDKEDRLGKKIYVTGNGRCNLFHEQTAQFLDAYSNYKEAKGAFKRVPLSTLKKVFSSLGLDTIKQGELYYPRTLSAKTVMDVFNFWIKKLNIQIWTKKELKQYERRENGFLLHFDNKDVEVDRLVLALGGASSSQLGSDGAWVKMLKAHHYEISPFYPGLVGLKVKEDISSLQGLRYYAKVTLYKQNEKIHDECGEVQFKNDGVSGIVIMNTSSYIARLKDPSLCHIELDLLPEWDEERAYEKLKEKENHGYPYLDGTFPSSLARLLEKKTQTKGKKTDEEKRKIIKEAKHFILHVSDFYSFTTSQVTVGGVSLNEVNENFASKEEKGLYLLGEMLDMDALCGGYNLMWAWATAYLASKDE